MFSCFCRKSCEKNILQIKSKSNGITDKKLCAICVQLLLDFLSVQKGEGVGEANADPLAGLNARDQSVRPSVIFRCCFPFEFFIKAPNTSFVDIKMPQNVL